MFAKGEKNGSANRTSEFAPEVTALSDKLAPTVGTKSEIPTYVSRPSFSLTLIFKDAAVELIETISRITPTAIFAPAPFL